MGSAQESSLPTLRWGIIGTGLISSWYVADLVLARKNAKAQHIIQAIGSSSTEKGQAFVARNTPNSKPTVYNNYDGVYSDPDVDIVYIGTPHAFHKQNCLDAIAAGKHVLCEKAFTLTEKEARVVLNAAKEKGVFIMEALWTRFTPLVQSLQNMIFEKKVIGDVRRVFCDFTMDMETGNLGPESRLKNPSLGAGSLLDIGIYSLMWGLIALDTPVNHEPSSSQNAEQEEPSIHAVQTLYSSIDIATTILLHYPSDGRTAILTSSTTGPKTPRTFCTIEGSNGTIRIEGLVGSAPDTFTIYKKSPPDTLTSHVDSGEKGEVHNFEHVGKGFYYEADAVAIDIAEGRKENAIMSHRETLRVMGMMDEIRRQGGARFPQDDE